MHLQIHPIAIVFTVSFLMSWNGGIDFLEFLNCTLFDSWSNFQIIIRLSVDDVINFYVDVELLKKERKMWISKLDGKHVINQIYLNVLDMILSQKL